MPSRFLGSTRTSPVTLLRYTIVKVPANIGFSLHNSEIRFTPNQSSTAVGEKSRETSGRMLVSSLGALSSLKCCLNVG